MLDLIGWRFISNIEMSSPIILTVTCYINAENFGTEYENDGLIH